MKKVCVSGGQGFIGTHVIEELNERGYETYSFDRSFGKDNVRTYPVSPANFFIGDIRDHNSVDEVVRLSDGVINLAGLLGTAEAVDDPFPAADTNINGGLNFLAAIRKYDKPGVQISVGNHFENNTYSITKTTIERFALMYAKEHKTRVVVVRGLNAYGPGQHHKPIRKIMPNFVTRALRGEPINIYGDGKQVMDMIWVKDLARILVNALEHADRFGGLNSVLEAGTGRQTTVNEIAAIVASTTQDLYRPYPAGKNTEFFERTPMRPGETPGSVVLGDPDTLGIIGIHKRHFKRLEDGVKETVEWYHDNYDWKND